MLQLVSRLVRQAVTLSTDQSLVFFGKACSNLILYISEAEVHV